MAIWNDNYQKQALAEGWLVSNLGSTRFPLIEITPAGNNGYGSKLMVWSHVVEHALKNSELHLRALCSLRPDRLFAIINYCGPNGVKLIYMIISEKTNSRYKLNRDLKAA